MKTIPTVGSEVEVTVRYPNYNYFTSNCQPFNDTLYKGVVVKNAKWIAQDCFCVKTDNKLYPLSIINLSKVHGIKILKGDVAKIRKFKVLGTKGHTYLITLSNGHYTCHCIGFQYHNKCKHITKVQDVVEKQQSSTA
jgi:hypothetical protein